MAWTPVIDRLTARLFQDPNSGCWLYEGRVNKYGYGKIGGRKRITYATHRVSYQHYVGTIPEGMLVCHKCDTPSCCNPNHLFLGSNADNVADRTSKRRDARGSGHGMALLDEGKATEIFGHLMAGDTLASIAKRYGVSISTINAMKRGRTWQKQNPNLSIN